MEFVLDLLGTCGCASNKVKAQAESSVNARREPLSKTATTRQARNRLKPSPTIRTSEQTEYKSEALQDYLHDLKYKPAPEVSDSASSETPTKRRRNSLSLVWASMKNLTSSTRRVSMTDIEGDKQEGEKQTPDMQRRNSFIKSLVQSFSVRSPASESRTPEAVSPEPGTSQSPSMKRRGSFFASLKESFRSKEGGGGSRRNSEETAVKGRRNSVYLGEMGAMLYDYIAEGATPFPPDTRQELTAAKGTRLDILETRPDGWCLVRKPWGSMEYWLPGNHLTTDGTTPYVD